jgi:serine/threonine protein kinase
VNEQNNVALLLEDFEGVSLDSLYSSGNRLSVKEFLPIAAKIITALADLHQRGVTQKDINPSNMLYNVATHQIKVIDFGIAILLPEKTVSFQQVNTLEGTLAYISPEQTGRMNRTVDYRSDFYALGLFFFQLLTGLLPFKANDGLKLVHAHLTTPSAQAHALFQDVPERLSQILFK